MRPDAQQFNDGLAAEDKNICDRLAQLIDTELPDAENRIWHAHPVWFFDGNPIVGYSKLKYCVRLLFWSGQSFETAGLTKEGKFKAAEVRFTSEDQIDEALLVAWLGESRQVQWDYKNIVKRKGVLERLK